MKRHQAKPRPFVGEIVKNDKFFGRGRITTPRAWGRHLIRKFAVGGIEYTLHATKGWRSTKVNA